VKNISSKIVGLVICLQLVLTCSTPKSTDTESANMNIIPKPQHIETLSGKYIFGDLTSVWIGDDVASKAFFKEYLATLIPNLRQGTQGKAEIQILLDPDANLPEEGYILSIGPGTIRIVAIADPGLFYGIQTLRQLLPSHAEKGGATIAGHTIQAAVISDYPRFEWRGMHLDVSRHFFPTDFVKRYIDMIARAEYIFIWPVTSWADSQGLSPT